MALQSWYQRHDIYSFWKRKIILMGYLIAENFLQISDGKHLNLTLQQLLCKARPSDNSR